MAIGRISGPLLKANLLREGVNLAFENDLLYLDVNNSRIGINNATPQYDLDVTGTSRTPTLNVTTSATLGDITISGSGISTSQDILSLGTSATNSVVYQNKLHVDDLELINNQIKTTSSNAALELRPNGTGTVEVYANTNVYGDITATGSITADGNITIGDADTDNVTFNAEIASNIIPDATNTYNIGSNPNTGGKQWNEVWASTVYAGTVNADNIAIDGIDLNLRQGNIFYVAENGNDALTGTHPNDPYASITQALSSASAGDTVHIYPGVYQETFPMTIPVGVTVKGHTMRGVNITPAPGTQNNDAFLLNGETTVEDVTIKDFYNGYAFKFAPGYTVTTRSPYIRNVSVITQGSVTTASDPRGFNQGDAGKGAYLDGSVATSGSRESGCLFHSVTFITPGVDGLTVTNGTRVEWLNCFTYFANRGLYALDGSTGLKGTGKTAVRVSNLTGSFNAAETFTYYDTDGLTVLATGTIDSKDADNKFYVNGNLSALQEATERTGKTITRYQNPVTDTAIKKFGTSSLILDGTEDYIGIASNNDFGFAAGDFTIEGFFYFDSVAGIQSLMDFRSGANTDIGLYLNLDAGVPKVYINGATVLTGSITFTTSTWYHVAISRTGTTMKMFVDGTEEATGTVSTNLGIAKPLLVGTKWDASTEFLDGNVDEIRITKGTGRYTSGFGSISSEFVSDTNTVLLLHFNNADDSSETIIDDATQSQDLRFSGGATASFVTLADKTDFGGEIRSIASANIYGNYGAYGDGSGVLMYLISQNFAYIGAGKEVTNDNANVVQGQEITELNGAKVRYSSVDQKGDFRVGDLFHVNQQDGTVDFTSSEFNIDTTSGLTITTGASTTTLTGTEIDTGNLRLSGNTLSSLSGDINLSSASGNVKITSNGSLQLPTGNTASRPTPANGMIRYNTDTSLFEGYDGNWRALSGVYDIDQDTYITPELTPGANDNTIRMYINGAERLSLTDTTLETPRIDVDDIYVDGNVVGITTADTNLQLSANGTGEVTFDNLSFKDSTITNTQADTPLLFQQQGNGYFKIEGTNGFIVPVGTNVERPPAINRETGMVRFNTQQSYLEIYDGTSWVSVAGTSGSISYTAAEELAIEYVILLG
ncbi:hypothetical protein OAA64_01335 [bacterium]|nr:hypothetical protein [bacterium]